MKNILIAVLFVFPMFLFLSCEDKEEDTLSLLRDSFEFEAEGASGEVQLLTNRDWYINSATEWLSFVPTSGSGNSKFVVNAITNTEDTDRSTTFSVHAGKKSEMVRISQKGRYLSLEKQQLLFAREGTPQTLQLTTRYNWEINPDSEGLEWCHIEPLSGTGDAVLLLTPDVYEERVPRYNDKIEIICNGSSYILLISQEIENVPPTQPVLLTPEDGTDVGGLYPYFSWEESTDEDEDPVYYTILVSKDKGLDFEQWEDISGRITETDYMLTRKRLEENTIYYWTVAASDDFQGITYTDIFQFKTGENYFYEDDEVQEIRKATYSYPANPNVVILGDGFIRDDFGKGNIFDVVSDMAIDAFFSLEPFASYQDYFNVYKIVTYSEESGATVYKDFLEEDVKAQVKNTAFKSSFDGGDSPGIKCDTDLIFSYVQNALGLTDEELNNTTIVLVINLEVYAGTTAMHPDGRSIAMCPIGKDTFESIVRHEAAGHGFGRLVDEYIYHPNLYIEEDDINYIQNARGDDIWSFGANVSLTRSEQQVHWAHYLYLADYRVNFYEGACLYGKGIWRPEDRSCMDEAHTPYFNAPSREAIVRRIRKIIGEDFDFNDFREKDIQKYYQSLPTSLSTGKTRLGKTFLLK